MNGFSNEDTWALAVLIDNDEYHYKIIGRLADSLDADHPSAVSTFEDELREILGESDFIDDADIDLDEVDMDELLRHMQD